MENGNQHKKKRTGGGSVYNEMYNPLRIERLKSIVKDFYQQGKQKRYCILVDGEMVVTINSDSRNFDGYKKYMEGHTQSVEVRMYFGESPNCNRHIFRMSPTGLHGFPEKNVEERIQEALKSERLNNELESLRKENKRLRKDIEKYEELEEEWNTKKLDVNELLEKGLNFYAKYNASKQGVSPGAPVQGIPQAEVEIEAEPETESDRQFQAMKENHSEQEVLKGLKTWRLFTKHKDLRKAFAELVNQKQQKNGKTQV